MSFPTAPRAKRGIALSFLGLFVLVCALHLHGFSLPCWHDVIDGSAPTEVWLGEARTIRSDDWVVALPLIFSQRAQEPRYPVRNPLVGDGLFDTRVGPPVPIASWLTLFRPQLWGYFMGDDVGLAWHWWSRAIGLVAVWWLVFGIVGTGVWTALAMAIALLFSPFFQYWSANGEPMSAMVGLCFLATVGLVRADSARGIAVWGAVLAWAGGCFALAVIYPPFQVPLALLFLVLTGGYCVRERRTVARAGRAPARALALAGAALVVVCAVAAYYVGSAEALNRIAETAYPGQRRLAGGDLSVFQLFNNFYTAGLREKSLPPTENLCESALFFFFFPAVGAYVLWQWGLMRKRPDALTLALLGYATMLSVFAIFGVPELIARVTFFDRVPGQRALLAAGLANMTLLALQLSKPAGSSSTSAAESSSSPAESSSGSQNRSTSSSRIEGTSTYLTASYTISSTGLGAGTSEQLQSRRRFVPLAIALLFAGAMAGVGGGLGRSIPDIGAARLIVVSLLVAGLSWLFLTRRRVAAAILAALSIGATGWFNPVVSGGAGYLAENPLSQRIRELDRASGGSSTWVVYNDIVLPNLLRAIGVRALNGVHYYPQFDLWSRLDPEGGRSDSYNRYAHVVFALTEPGSGVELELPQEDLVVVGLHPESSAFAALDPDFLLYAGDDAGLLASCANLELVATYMDKRVYHVE